MWPKSSQANQYIGQERVFDALRDADIDEEKYVVKEWSGNYWIKIVEATQRFHHLPARHSQSEKIQADSAHNNAQHCPYIEEHRSKNT